MTFDDPLGFQDPDALLQEVQGIQLDLGQNEPTAPRQTEYPTSLVLAVDVSNSIDDDDYTIQRQGTGQALLAIKDDLLEMAENGNPAIITYVEFGANGLEGDAVIRIPPTILRDELDIDALASQIETMQREYDAGVTLPSTAMALGRDIHNQVEQEYGPLMRKVTDISADGFGTSRASRPIDVRLQDPDNQAEHQRVLAEREAAILDGVEINSIIMPDYRADVVRTLRATGDEQIRDMGRSGDGLDSDELDQLRTERPEIFTGPDSSVAQNSGYYSENVSTGFTLSMSDIGDYAEFMERKLRTELLSDAGSTSPSLEETGLGISLDAGIEEAGIATTNAGIKFG